ncbi:MAG TPA: DUF4382 domain-containing protein [Bacteriovoracaceae bacterium]|nr:DUF4382 domain-containing protein [Bacteriovoracaceae bacterium]
MKFQAVTLASLLLLVSCNLAGPDLAVSEAQALSNLAPVRLSVNLVDAPNDEIKNVFVSIRYIELLVENGGKKKNLIFGERIGSIDLLTLRDGVFLPVTELSLPANTSIKQIRLVLNDDENYLYRQDDSRCDLKTPSQQQSGTKILVKKTLTLEAGSDYKMVIDFDALKSVVLQGNGGCLLKPVLKLKSLVKSPVEVPEESDEGTVGEAPGESDDGPVGEAPGEEMIDPNDQPTSEPVNNL